MKLMLVTLMCASCAGRPLSLSGGGDGGGTNGGNTNGSNGGNNGNTNGSNGGNNNGTNGGNNGGTNGGNPPVAPRLLAPLSTATVTSQRPRLRWDMTGVTGAAEVDLCADRACTKPLGSATVDTSGAAALPDDNLAAGTCFWRVRAGTQMSATWELFVGRHSAPADSSYGAALDLDGDGTPEVAVATTSGVLIFSGGRAGLGGAPQLIANPDGAKSDFGYVLNAAGDLNGDGYGDLAVGECGKAGGQVHVYFGGPAGVSVASSQALTAPDNLEGFGCRLAGAGDLDGDGYADLVVSRVGPDYGGGLYVYRGGPNGLPATTTRIDSPDYKPSRVGNSLAGVGDLDGDGYADVVAAEIDVSALSGRIHIYRGGPDGLSNSREVTLLSPDPQSLQYGASVAGVGDVNGDGYPDFVVGSPAVSTTNLPPKAHLYLGRAGGIGVSTVPIDLTGSGVGFGVEVEGAGDADGDGYCDLVVSSNDGLTLFRGGPAGPSAGGLSLPALGQGANPRHLAAAGDLDGDGLADLLVLDGAGLEALLGGTDGFNRARLLTVFPPSGSFSGGVARLICPWRPGLRALQFLT